MWTSVGTFVSENRFIILFRSFDLTFFPFAFEKKGLCNPIFPFVKTIGPEVYKGKFRLCW